MKYKYFCGCCGNHFESDLPPKDASGFTSNISCPFCGVWDIYEDTESGAAESVSDLTEYENKLIEWGEDK